MGFDVREAFYSIVCLIALGLSAWGGYTILSVGMRAFIFTEADQFSSRGLADETPAQKKDREEVDRRVAVARRQQEFSWAFPVLIINLPIFFLFYPEVKVGGEKVAK